MNSIARCRFPIPIYNRTSFHRSLSLKTSKNDILSTSDASHKKNTKIHVISPDSKRGASQYILLPSNIPFHENDYKTNPEVRAQIIDQKIASLYASRNIIFGATMKSSTDVQSTSTLSDVCGPLVDIAIVNAEKEGDQVQAISTLHGLCEWVQNLITKHEHLVSKNDEGSKGKGESEAFDSILQDQIVYEAIKSIATGIPRPGHKVVGQGTYRDGKDAWIMLAREYSEKNIGEVGLYRSRGAESVSIEYLAETSEQYLRSAGGSMLRMYFM